MADTKTVRPEDKTILKTADEVANAVDTEERTPSKEFIPYLIIVDGPRAGTRFQLKEDDNMIGRSVSSVAMLEDASVSRRHSIINHTSGGGWVFKDAGSKNGSFVNGKKTEGQINIGHGDIIQVGIYALRLITKPVSSEEEMAPLPSDIEGKTIMMSADGVEKGGANAQTRTMAKTNEEGETGELEPQAGEEELKDEDAAEDDLAGELPLEPEAVPEKRRGRLVQYAAMGGALLLLAIVAGVAYWKFAGSNPPPPTNPSEPQVIGQLPGTENTAPKKIPVFLDFASSPLPARVSMDGQDYGLAPVKVNMELEVGKIYSAEAVFALDELQDAKTVKAEFAVEQNSNSIPILFKGQIGIIKINNLPRDTQLYLEGNYADDPFKPHTAKLANVVFGKPAYVPYGKYVVELRQPKQVGESNQFVEDIRFKREFQITEEGPLYEISVTDDDLEKFPVEIRTVPAKADVFMDGTLVGQTPYSGTFPLGEHTMTLRKDGYFEQTQTLKMDINMLYQVEIPLKTTVAGEYVNAGNTLMNKGLYKDAIAQLSEAFKHTPSARETAQIQYLLGSCYMKMNDFATAAGYFEQARQAPDFQLNAMLGLASIFGMQKDMERALPLLVEVMLKAQDEQLKAEASAVFQQISSLRSVMYIYTDPAGADVIVNDRLVGPKTPLILHDLGLGNYKIKIQKDGFVPQDLNINMSVAEFNPVIIKLKPIEQ
ncbi:MAG: hypothetical protein COV46_03995 [Deltaproteobacteria bacterium CG11_big_fil_rev_8_21_14_0_20_49_13]|nr:MAG: hypothetical protein COV46_03995 [Deltaproteobacteria bacterium CG11_big_fil_rev_8_21_14_0_20_49_13]